MNEKQLGFLDEPNNVQKGKSITDIIMSAFVGGNADLFPQILSLHVPNGSKIADVTFGKGIFWKNVNLNNYNLFPSDISTGFDCRELPYQNESFDAVILDPPYMEGLLRNNKDHKAGKGKYSSFREYYSNPKRILNSGLHS